MGCFTPRANSIEKVIKHYRSKNSSPSPSRRRGSSQSGAQSIVYELDTLRRKARQGLEQLSLVILCSCANKSQTITTEQCQVAAGSIWDGPKIINILYTQPFSWKSHACSLAICCSLVGGGRPRRKTTTTLEGLFLPVGKREGKNSVFTNRSAGIAPWSARYSEDRKISKHRILR